MRAAQYRQIAGPIEVVDLPRPTPPPGAALLRVTATGVCRSDWHAWQGHDPVPLPHVPGHEIAGVVAELGAGVTSVPLGQRVTVPFVCGCGVCGYCADGQAQVCPNQTQPGFTHDGSFAEYVVIHAAETNLVALPDDLDDVAAAALGCRFATSYRAVRSHARIEAGQWLAVHGCGGVGLSAVMLAVAVGARVVAIDVDPAALAAARALGAEQQVASAGLGCFEVAEQVREVTGGGAHAGLDAIGDPQAAVASVAGLRRRGRHVQVGLLLGDAATPPLPMDLVVSRELEVYGSHGLAARDYPRMLAEIGTGGLDPSRLVGRVIGLDEAGAALAAMSGRHDDPNPAGGAPADARTGMTVITF